MGAYLTIEGHHLKEIFRADVRLVALLERALELLPATAIKLTSLMRTKKDDQALGGSGVHCDGPPWRAADLAGPMTLEDYELAAQQLNAEWVYDADRPNLGVAVGKLHGTGPHLHLQVHPHTQKREE